MRSFYLEVEVKTIGPWYETFVELTQNIEVLMPSDNLYRRRCSHVMMDVDPSDLIILQSCERCMTWGSVVLYCMFYDAHHHPRK